MQKAIHHPEYYKIRLGPETYTYVQKERESFFKRFLQWCNEQEEKRFMWMAISFLGGIGLLLPLTLLSVVFLGNNSMALWMTVCVINAPVLVFNLAAQPTKVTLPALFFAWLVNALVITFCIFVYMVA